MEVTDKKLIFENRLVDKLDLMVKRLQGQDDSVVTLDGDEGMGKSNLAVGICYYISYKMDRKFDVSNIFFELDKLIKYASETKEQIILWDEAALGGLSTQWWKENQTKFMQLLMTARKKKHFICMCIPKFNYLREYFFVDRSIALLHVYARQNIHKGRFFYYTKKTKEILYMNWKRKRFRNYAKYRSFGGSFKKYMEMIFTPEQLKQYDKMKDAAILSINASPDKKNKYKDELEEYKFKFASNRNITDREKAEQLGVTRQTIDKWRKLRNILPIPTPVM